MTKEVKDKEKIVFKTNSPKETFEIGERLGKEASPGDIYTLIGNLGVGKTVFTQGFAKGLGIEENVNSPTFTIIQVYEEGRLKLFHFDVYRIGDISEMEELGYEEYFYSDGVTLIEWANLIEDIIPENAKKVTIRKDLEKGFDYREIMIEG